MIFGGSKISVNALFSESLGKRILDKCTRTDECNDTLVCSRGKCWCPPGTNIVLPDRCEPSKWPSQFDQGVGGVIENVHIVYYVILVNLIVFHLSNFQTIHFSSKVLPAIQVRFRRKLRKTR